MTKFAGDGFQDIFFTARDGLRLYAGFYPACNAAGRRRRPVLCLPGLTRNSRDFQHLAHAISCDPDRSRDVFALDYRGRGQSQFDSDWRNYALPIEMFDVLDFMILRGLHNATIIGTSRGGLIAMLMGAAQPATLGAVILNDIGPILETEGIARISGYVGRIPSPHNWDHAASLIKTHNQAHFPDISDAQWLGVAHQWFNEKDGQPVHGYDQNLSRAMAALKGGIPELWPQFETLKHVPLLILRGENSDILSQSTVDEMLRRHPAASSFTVEGQGHAPLLQDVATVTKVLDFLAQTDQE